MTVFKYKENRLSIVYLHPQNTFSHNQFMPLSPPQSYKLFQLISTIIYFIYIFSERSVFHCKTKDCCYLKEIMSEIFKIAIPILVFQLFTSIKMVQLGAQ